MEQGKNRVLDELAKLATDAVGAAQGIKNEAESIFRGQAEKIINKFDGVKREDFEVLRDMTAKLHLENENLKKRVENLEQHLKSNPKETEKSLAAKEKK